MKFFDESDFTGNTLQGCFTHFTPTIAAAIANAKIDREYLKVYGCKSEGHWGFNNYKLDESTHTAFILCIEPIVKCTHPPDKVIRLTFGPENLMLYTFQCECGAKLKITSFEEIK